MGGANTTATNQDPEFQKWKSQYAPNDSGVDYDLYGAYKSGLKPDAERGHFPDTFKKTNHPTFSVESKYSTPEHPGGVWGKDATGNDTFTPSEWMASDPNRIQGLKEYFSKAEPNATLIIQQQNKTNTMGGLNTKQGGTNQARRDRLEFEKNFTGNPPPMSEEELATYARIDAESDGANSYKRSASVIDPASVIKKNQELLKKPMSSYEAIDVGLK